MTLPFLKQDLHTANEIPNVWGTCMAIDSIEMSISNGERFKCLIDQLDSIFSVKLVGNDHYVCLVIVLVDNKEPTRFIMAAKLATDLINHANQRKFLCKLDYEEEARFFLECR